MLGYIPKRSRYRVRARQHIAQGGLVRFADRFDVDENGVNIIANVVYNNDNQSCCV